MASSNETLGKLHEAVTEVLIQKMAGRQVPVFDEEGNETGEFMTILPSAAEIQAAAKFLADNKVTSIAGDDNKLGELASKMDKVREERAARAARRATGQDLADADNANFLSRMN